MVYGRSTGLSPVAVVVSATFWTALWGPIGLVLATPLTVCLVVLGRHVERLAFLDVMFGDRPALSPPEIFYQRMLAGDPTEAAEKAEEFLKERSLSSYYDEVALPGLRLAQADLDREVLDVARLVKIRDAVSEFAADLSDPVENTGKHETVDPEAAAALDGAPAQAELRIVNREELSGPWQSEHAVLCIAGRTPLDEAAGLMFMDLVRANGLEGRIEGAETLATANIFRMETAGVALVCLSYLDTSSPAHMRFTVRRIRRKLPTAIIMLGVWNGDIADANLEQLRENAKADLACRSLHDAVNACITAAQSENIKPKVAQVAAVAS
jgi:hypothetical protein